VKVAGLVGANLLMLAAGVGLLPLLGMASSWRALVQRSGLAYLCGIVLSAVLAAHLALVRVSFGWIGLSLLAAISVGFTVFRLRGTELPVWRRPGWLSIVTAAGLAALLVEYARAFALAPLDRYDAWAIWALKGHALYSLGWADPVVFGGSEYRFANLDYPLFLPSLEAIDFRVMGAFDTQLVHLQFLFLFAAALAALATLLRDRVPTPLLCFAVAAIAVAPDVFDQLLTAYADLPLALVFAVGLAAAGRWLVTNERWSLTLATLCFGGALLTKNEGTLFVVATFVALFAVAYGRWRALAVAAAADVLVLLPWKLYVRVHDLHDINYSLGDTFDWGHVSGRLGVGHIAFRELADEMTDPLQWGLLAPLFVLVLVLAVVAGARRLSVFAAVWALLSWLGLSWIYVISHYEYSSYLSSTQDRVVASLVLGAAALTPLLAAEAWASARGRDRPRDDVARTP
jgi:hypothetical protein